MPSTPRVVTRFAPSPTGYPAHRRRAHGALQLALRPPHRRPLPAAHRGHRPRPLHPGGDRGDLRGPALARPRLGRRGDQPVRARPPPRRGGARDDRPRHRLSLLVDRRGDRGLPRAGEGRGPPAALPLALARRRPGDRARTRPTSSACARRARARPWSRTWCRARVTWKNETLDDLILLRSDGTPTYMLAVVVDDHDMGVTHVIRGDDHLTNAARQTLIYRAMDWERAGLRPYPADPRPRRRQALQAPRRARDRGLPRHGLPAGGDAQLSGAARLEPRQRRVLHHRAGDRLVRPHPSRQGAGPLRLRQAREPLGPAHPRRRRRAPARRARSLSCSAEKDLP